MLRRYDLARSTVPRMWRVICKMNKATGSRSLAAQILKDHPELDPALVFAKVLAIRHSEN